MDKYDYAGSEKFPPNLEEKYDYSGTKGLEKCCRSINLNL